LKRVAHGKLASRRWSGLSAWRIGRSFFQLAKAEPFSRNRRLTFVQVSLEKPSYTPEFNCNFQRLNENVKKS
jgi:hypothetical protein